MQKGVCSLKGKGSIYTSAITWLHPSLMRKIKGIIGTEYSLRPRSRTFQQKAIINLYVL
jgi:hypothetical protein